MPSLSTRILALATLSAVLLSCSRELPPADDLLQHVPDDTPYVFVSARHLPEPLRGRLADHNAVQLAAQRSALVRVRGQLADSGEGPAPVELDRFFDLLDAVLIEFDGRDTAVQLRELGIEPMPRSVFYGIGLLPAMRIEITDAARLEATLGRIEARAGASAERAVHDGLDYRRFDLGPIDAVLAVDAGYLVAGLLADQLFEQDLPLLLGRQRPAHSLADSGAIEALVEQHSFSGYGEGFVKLDQLLATLLGKDDGRSGQVMQALGAESMSLSDGCAQLGERLVTGMPRIAVGVTAAEDRRLATRAIWEASPAVANYLQKLAAPVPGVGAAGDGLLALGVGIDLPQLRNAIEALLRQVSEAGGECEWVDREVLASVGPQLSLVLGPMTAGIHGFNLILDDLKLDPDTMQPTELRAGLLASVDDPRGIFALGAMLDPALASFELPGDGSFAVLPRAAAVEDGMPPLRVAAQDRALLLIAGDDSDSLGQRLGGAAVASPAPLFALDYGVGPLLERLGGVMAFATRQLEAQGETDLAAELGEQLEAMRLQAELVERLRVSLYASAAGLVFDEEIRLR